MWDEINGLGKKVTRLEELLEEACHHLMWVLHQYGETKEGFLIHKDMCAGEDAGEFLEKFGYVECGGWEDTLTEKGKSLMLKEYI